MAIEKDSVVPSSFMDPVTQTQLINGNIAFIMPLVSRIKLANPPHSAFSTFKAYFSKRG
jgi:hypothetical protein